MGGVRFRTQPGREVGPALTPGAVPTVDAAELGVQLLLELIQAPGEKVVDAAAHEMRVRVTSQPHLVVRASTGPAFERRAG